MFDKHLSKEAEYKFNLEKSNPPIYKQWLGLKKNRETAPFTKDTNKQNILVITLDKEVKDVYKKNFKSLKKKIEENIRSWKDLPCSLISRLTK